MSEIASELELRIKRMGNNWEHGNVEAAATALRLYRAREVLFANARVVMAQYDLSHAEFDTLVSLRTMGPQLKPTSICEANLVSSGGMTKVLKSLEEHGYITRTQDAADQRCRMARLTKKGEQVTDEALSAVLARHERSLASVFTKKERQELDRLLTKLGGLA